MRNTGEVAFWAQYSPIDHHIDKGLLDHGRYDDQGIYLGLSTVSEVKLIFTTQLFSC